MLRVQKQGEDLQPNMSPSYVLIQFIFESLAYQFIFQPGLFYTGEIPRF
jgi:hypothetical protein